MPPDPGEQYKYSLSIVRLYGQETLDRLVREKSLVKKYRKKELEELLIHYKDKLKDLAKRYGNPWE